MWASAYTGLQRKPSSHRQKTEKITHNDIYKYITHTNAKHTALPHDEIQLKKKNICCQGFIILNRSCPDLLGKAGDGAEPGRNMARQVKKGKKTTKKER